MKFFSGFGFSGEDELFEELLDSSEYAVAGFSFGAQKALQEALNLKRVQKLTLISPGVFTHLSYEEKRKQIELFRAKKEVYLSMFYKKCGAKDEHQKYFKNPSLKELEELFSYEWKESDLSSICKKGCKIEVYIGDRDKIVDIEGIKRLFMPYSTLYIHHGVGHILK